MDTVLLSLVLTLTDFFIVKVEQIDAGREAFKLYKLFLVLNFPGLFCNGIPEFLVRGRKSWVLDSGRWTMDTGLWTLDAGLWTLDAGLWTLGARRWTLDGGRWTLDALLWTLKP